MVNKKNQSGMTLIEMLIAIFIFTLGIIGFTQLFVASWQSNHFSFEMGTASSAVSSGLSKIGDYIKRAGQGDDGAYPVVAASNNELTIYCDYNKDGTMERLHFYKESYVDGGYTFYRIVMGIRTPTTSVPKTYASGDESTQIIVKNIVNADNVPIFYYFDKNYAGASGQSNLSSPINVADVRLVKVYLKININPNRVPDNIEMQSFNEMRNLNDYNSIK